MLLRALSQTNPHTEQKMKNDSGEDLPIDHIERKVSSPSESNSPDYIATDLDHGFSPEEQRRIMWRLDRRLVSVLGIMYCVSLMDRTNLASAIIAGMGTELMLIGNRYVSFPPPHTHTDELSVWASFGSRDPADKRGQSIITLVFFITYIVFQPPSTVIVRKVGPRIHLASITTAWGAVMIGMGFVRNWDELAGLRVILGVLEAGFFPSCVYLLSTWYTRCEWTPSLPPNFLPDPNTTNKALFTKSKWASATQSSTSSVQSPPAPPASSPTASCKWTA